MMRAEKAEKYNQLRKRRNTPEFEWWFLRYIPHMKNQRTKVKKKNNQKETNSEKEKNKKTNTKKTII